LTEYRLLHSIGVADTAASMAEQYGVNVNRARIAGLLHDWDKNLSDEQLVERAREFDIEMVASPEDMAALLHAQTGAAAVKDAFPELGDEVAQAIARHTAAAPDMTRLDMVVYVADLIEPSRSRAELASLRDKVGTLPLEALFFTCLEITMTHLIRSHRVISPSSLEVWNSYASKGMTEYEQECM
jgi:predicted HD superfamily hydrolase involved in NAD metabolism